MWIRAEDDRARRPLLAAALACALGAAVGGFSELPPMLPALAAAAALGFALAGLRSRGAWAALLVALAAVQALRSAESRARSRVRPQPHALHEGIWRPSEGSTAGTFGRLEGAGPGAPWFELPPGLARAGERLRLEPNASPRAPARGPAPARRADRPVVQVEAHELERVAPQHDHPLRAGLRRLRHALAARCDRLSSPRAAALARALLFGDRSRLDPATSDLFTRTGLRHLLAVSGLHVALFAGIMAWPLAGLAAAALARCRRSWAPRQRELRLGLLALGLLLYASLAGGAAPVRRASLAAVLACVAPLVGRRANGGVGRSADALSLWSLALLFELLADPGALRAVGIQLSFAATLGLVLGAGPLARAWTRGGGSAELAPVRGQLGQALEAMRARGLHAARTALAASVVASLATLPVLAVHFGEWSPVGIVLTPPALVLVACALPLGWCALFAPRGFALPERLFELATGSLEGLARAADRLPGTPSPLPERPVLLVAGTVAAILVALALRERRPRAARVLTRAAAGASACLLVPWTLAPTEIELVALDVGHGTSVAVRTPRGDTWVFDAGSRDRTRVGPGALGPLLARWEAARPAVVLSHGDQDHAAAVPWLVERYPPRLFAGALPAPLDVRLAHGTPRIDLAGAGELTLAEGPWGEIRLLRGRSGSGNEGSRSLWVAQGGQGALLCGDAEQEGLRDLLARWRPRGDVELLLLPHHGSHTPWLGPLLERAAPREVWISGRGPPPVGPELDRRGLEWSTTATAGPLQARLGAPSGTELAADGSKRNTEHPSSAGS